MLFDPDTPFVLDRATLRSKSKNTPYDLRRMQGRVLRHLGRRPRGLRAGRRMTLALTAVLAYLLGSIPFGVLITRALGLGDLRSIGSGNIGATNVLRTGNKGGRRRDAAARRRQGRRRGPRRPRPRRRGRGDAGRPRGLPRPSLPGLAAASAAARASRPSSGVTLALAWPAGLAACATWLATAFATRYSSLAALVAAATTPLWLVLFGPPGAVWLGVALAVLVFVRHRANISRLLAGTESKIGTKSNGDKS